MAQTLPPALEQDLRKFDTMQRNYETMAAQSQTWQMELNQVKATLEEVVLEKTLNSMKKKVESLAASLKELQEKIQLELSKHNLRLQ
jgi:chaperonin cofactor prefoldin